MIAHLQRELENLGIKINVLMVLRFPTKLLEMTTNEMRNNLKKDYYIEYDIILPQKNQNSKYETA